MTFSSPRHLHSGPVADFLAVLSVLVFAALMLGLVRALERV
ncbi:MAG: hypothetical protein ABSC73_06580 [Acidimicrobiales bacterium]